METTSLAPSLSDPGPCLHSALHELGISLIVVDSESTIVYANRAARAELARSRLLRVHERKLHCAISGQAGVLTAALQSAANGRRSMIEIGRGGDARMHAVIPIGAATSVKPMALVCSGGHETGCGLALTMFARAAGLTSSEQDVLTALCGGLAAREIAAERAVSLSTIRTQITNIRQKIGVNSVGQLIRKVYMLPPMWVRDIGMGGAHAEIDASQREWA